MINLRFLIALSLMVLLFSLYACHKSESNQKEPVFKQLPEIKEIKPEKPVRIKLKRNAGGSYSWEVNGDDADKVLAADKKLRESLKNLSSRD
jgi:hypothetical protein